MLAELERRKRGLEERLRAIEDTPAAPGDCYTEQFKAATRYAAARDRLQIYEAMETDAARGLSLILDDRDGAIKWLNAERKRITRNGRKKQFTTTEIVQLFEIDEAKADISAAIDGERKAIVHIITPEQEAAIKCGMAVADAATEIDRRAVVLRLDDPSPDAVAIISNKVDARGHSLEAGETIGKNFLVIYAPGAYDLEAEIKKTYPAECDFKDVLFRYTEKYHALKKRYLAKCRGRAQIRETIRQAFAGREVSFVDD